MITFLKGILAYKKPPMISIDVHGVGYEVFVPMSTFFALPAVDQPLFLFTHHSIREDGQSLYGFLTEQDRALFRELIKVNGVGPKLGLTLLSGMDTASLVRAIADQDTVKLTKLPGVGPKMAQRLIIEMRDKVSRFDGLDSVAVIASHQSHSQLDEAMEALLSLGYKPGEAKKMLDQCPQDLDAQGLIRAALKR
ncbi:MAG: Holliday junction branch migration protein RuvA [Gammaproteobacteria bacterium]